MALLEQNVLTLADHATRWGTKEAQMDASAIIDTMLERNPILEDQLWTPSNMSHGHKTMLRVEHPSSTWVQLNKGVPKSKSVSTAIIDTMASLEALCEVDNRMKRQVDNFPQLVDDESIAFMESMSNEYCSILFYGDEVSEPNAFTGLTPRYNDVSLDQVIDGGGTGSDNASLWIINWGMRGLTGIFPRNSTSGLQRRFNGDNVPTNDSSGNRYFSWSQSFFWDCGLAVANHKEAVRIANIDMSDAQANNANAADLVKLISRGLMKLYTPPRAFIPTTTPGAREGRRPSSVRTVIYCNAATYALLWEQANERTVNGLIMGQAFGQSYPTVNGIPVKICDALLTTEAQVV